MCRTTDFYFHEDRLLRLKAISLRLSLSSAAADSAVTLLPASLTLVFLPRINGGPRDVNGSEFSPDSPAFLSLHSALHSDVVFASDDSIRVCDGVVFEVHVAENSFLRGVFRQCDNGGLRMECKFVAERELGRRRFLLRRRTASF